MLAEHSQRPRFEFHLWTQLSITYNATIWKKLANYIDLMAY